MKIRELILIFMSATLLIVSSCLYVRYRNLNRTWKNAVEAINDVKKEHDLLSTYRTNRFYELTLNGTLIDENEFVSDTTGVQHRLTDILSDRTLFFRYSSSNCLSCIEAQLETINNIPDSVNFNIIFLASHSSDQEMKRFVKMHNIRHKIYKLNDILNEQIMDIGVPYYFIFDENSRRLNKVFVPMKESPQLTDDYLNSVMTTF